MDWDRWPGILRLRLRSLFRRRLVERELDEELRDHLERQVDQLVAAGVPAVEARAVAWRMLGGMERRKDECRDARGTAPLEHLLRDLRVTLRGLARSPGYATAVVLTLALGTGATTAIFTVVNGVLLRPLSYRDPDQLVVLEYRQSSTMAAANFLDLREQSHSFAALGAAEWWSPSVAGGDHPEELQGLHLSAGIWPLLGVAPLLGRVFGPEEEHAGRDRVVVLSYELWRSRFGGTSDIVGRRLTIDGDSYQVIGVMPPGFRFAPYWATGARLWAPLVLDQRRDDRGGASLRVFGRLGPGITLDAARAEVRQLTARLEAAYPGTTREGTVVPLLDKVVGGVRQALLVLLGAVGLVLLIACANVAHLQLLRAAAREREFAVRGALGGSRARLVQQSLVESAVLALAGGGAGLALAGAGVRLLVRLAPAGLPRLEGLVIDRTVLLFALWISLAATLLFGLAPARAAARADLQGLLRAGGRGSSDGPAGRRRRGMLVASEIALALMLLVGAGLLLRSFAARRGLATGFDPDGVLSAVVSLRGTAHADWNRRAALFGELVDRAAGLPGVISAGATNHLPLHGDNWHFPFAVEGRPLAEPGQEPRALFRIIRPGYFQTMGIPVVAGRDLRPEDLAAEAPVVIVNQSMARRHWPGTSPLGSRLTVDGPARHPEWFTVIGVVQDSRQAGWGEQLDDEMYFPHYAVPDPGAAPGTPGTLLSYLNPLSMTVVLRSREAATAPLAGLQQAVADLDRDATISDIITMDQAVGEQFAEPRFYLLLLGCFAGVALALAVVGIYGVMAYSVARRAHEIGIRLALGAAGAEIFRLIAGEGLRLAAAGILAGAIGAVALSRFLRSLLFGVGPADPPAFLLAILLLAGAAAVTAAIPARRAARVNPLAALSSE